MSFKFSIRTDQGEKDIELSPGSSLIFVGANGSGKTRLAVQIEQDLHLQAHRISAHRALTLNPDVEKISEEKALSGLRTGDISQEAIRHRERRRWGNNGAVKLLDDFDFLIQALFAEQSNTSLKAYQNSKQRHFNSEADEQDEQFQFIKIESAPKRV